MKMKIKVDTTEFELEFTDFKEACIFLQEFVSNNKVNELKFEDDKKLEDDGK